MSTKKVVTLRLDEHDFNRLADEARRLGMQPGTPARVYVRAGLSHEIESERDERNRQTLAAIESMQRFRAKIRRQGYPSVDAVKVVREGRDELEQRFPLP